MPWGVRRRVAFALDIDGVLLHAKKPIEGAIEALAELGGQSDAWRVPIVFLTNGGGVDEASKARELEHLLQLRAGVHASQVILAHTPFRTLGASRPDETRLVVGRGSTPQVARAYWGPSGDRGIGCDIVTTRDLIRSAGTRMVPFSSHIDFDPRDGARGRIDPMPTLDGIGSVWVFTDPRGDDWYHDLQVVLDTLLSGGAPVSGEGESKGERVPPLYVAQRDLLFANGFHSPRLGLGAWVRCLERVYKSVTGKDLAYECFGKPNPDVYQLAASSLRVQADALGWSSWGTQRSDAIMAVGDNLSVDIRGANSAGWESSLVMTGVARAGELRDAKDRPTFVRPSVLEVVRSEGFGAI